MTSQTSFITTGFKLDIQEMETSYPRVEVQAQFICADKKKLANVDYKQLKDAIRLALENTIDSTQKEEA